MSKGCLYLKIFKNICDDYVKNYEKIAFDHVEAIKVGIENPFIPSDAWNEMEDNTVAVILKYIYDFGKQDKIRVLYAGVGY